MLMVFFTRFHCLINFISLDQRSSFSAIKLENADNSFKSDLTDFVRLRLKKKKGFSFDMNEILLSLRLINVK